ncbi:MAG: hypothetical protein M5U28_15435 [Sandaracinaceae bacterium]|nr:hypothetical protein [Sandaracinaceae bacterium]
MGVIDTLVGEDAYLRREAPGLRLVPEGWSISNSPWAPTALHHEPDGSLLVAYNRPTDDLPHWNAYPRLVRISSAGVTHLAGAPCPNPSEACDYGTLAEVEAEEGLNATDVPLGTIRAAELAPDGSFFLIENGTFVRRIAPNGAISRVAGIGNVGSSTGNDGPALAAGIENARDLAVAPDGTIYLLEGQVRVRQIGTDAIISQVLEQSVAGTPSCSHTDPGHCHPCRRDLWAPGDPLYGGDAAGARRLTSG